MKVQFQLFSGQLFSDACLKKPQLLPDFQRVIFVTHPVLKLMHFLLCLTIKDWGISISTKWLWVRVQLQSLKSCEVGYAELVFQKKDCFQKVPALKVILLKK